MGEEGGGGKGRGVGKGEGDVLDSEGEEDVGVHALCCEGYLG